MWKAALIMTIAFGAFAFGLIRTATTYDGRSDPCAAVPEACAEETEPPTTTSTTSTTAPPTTTVVTTVPVTTVP